MHVQEEEGDEDNEEDGDSNDEEEPVVDDLPT